MKRIVNHFVKTFEISNINWSSQMLMVKRLLKEYSEQEIIYAIDYYKSLGKDIYSLGYLSKCMDKPIREMKALQQIELQDGSSSERNKRKFRENNETFSGEKCFGDLFKESDKID